MAKIRKSQIPDVLQQIGNWQESYVAPNISSLPVDCREWLVKEIAALKDRVRAQDYEFAIVSQFRHIKAQAERMVSGDIVSVDYSPDGSCFHLR